jgi:hypothetical protein
MPTSTTSSVWGRCGRQLHVEYKTHHHYVCSALGKEYGAPICLYVGGGGIDAAVVTAFFSALQPAELALLDEVLAAQHAEQARLAQQYADRVARAEYEARLAQRQYSTVDPDNRLVAAELEQRWELALRARAEAQEAAERFAAQPQGPTLDPELHQQLSDLGPQLPALWSSGRLSSAHKKALLRSLVRRVILTRPRPDAIDLVIVWISGASTHVTARTTAYQTREVERYSDLVTRIGALAAAGYPDRMIAEQLTQEGFHSARQDAIPPSLVTRLRRSHHHPSLAAQFRGQDQIAGAWTVWGLSRALQVDRNWLYARMRDGTMSAERHPVLGYYLIANSTTVLQALRDRLPARRSS